MKEVEIIVPDSIAKLEPYMDDEGCWQLVVNQLNEWNGRRWLDPESYAHLIVMRLIHKLGLHEYGTSIRTGWLTKDGFEALDFLNKYGVNWAETGWFKTKDGEMIGFPPGFHDY